MIIVVVLLLGWLVFRPTEPKEPSYQGRKLSEWIDEWAETTWKITPSLDDKATSQAAKVAVKVIGTNALPILLEWLKAKDSPLKSRLNSCLDRQSYIQFRFRTSDYWYGMAMAGFALLGDDAKTAIPDLKKLSLSGDAGHRRGVFDCLCSVDEGKGLLLPLILEKLHDPDDRMQVMAGLHLNYYYPEEAEKAGVYQMFPKLNFPKPKPSIKVATNSPATK